MIAPHKSNFDHQRNADVAAPPVGDEDADVGNSSDRTSSEEMPANSATASLIRRCFRRWVSYWDARRTPAFLLSLVAHTAVLLVLALLTLAPTGGPKRSFDFNASVSPDEALDEAVPMLASSGDSPPPPTLQPEASEAPVPDVTLEPEFIPQLLNVTEPVLPRSTAGSLAQVLEASASSPSAAFSSTGVSGRSADLRRQVALARGGTIQSEEAVERALDWLAEHQLPNGGWSLIHDRGKCNGRCRNNGSPDRFDPAATGLSLLAFLGAGYTHREGKHRDTVRKGIYFLQQIMEDTPQGGSFLYQCDRGMYNHGIASFALCEAYQLTQDKDLKQSAQKALNFIAAAQNYQGGWGYLPKQPGDLTLSGWQIMALKSGMAAGLDLPPATIIRIDPFLDTQQTPATFFYGYRKPGKSSTCTAIGLLLRLFRGTPHTDTNILSGADFLSKTTRPGTDAYYNYYSTLFLYHVGQPFWESWNAPMREHLIRTQARTGHEAGSWYFEDTSGREGGRLYTTAMSAMTLEVYYRFAPLYQQKDVHFEP